MISDLIEETVVEAAAFLGPIAVPHFLPNRAPGLTDALHAGQINSSFAPHSSQNGASAVLSWLQDGQRIESPVTPITTTLCADGGRSGVLLEQAGRGRSTSSATSPSHFRVRLEAWHGWVLSPSYDLTEIVPLGCATCLPTLLV
jgi:hypothetical protein